MPTLAEGLGPVIHQRDLHLPVTEKYDKKNIMIGIKIFDLIFPFYMKVSIAVGCLLIISL